MPIIGMIIFLLLGLALGSNVVIAQSIGRRDFKGVQKAVHTALMFSLIAGIVIAVAGQFAVAPILGLLDIPEDVLPAAITYLKIYLLGMPIILLYNFEAAVFRSVGETQMPLKALIVASIINIVLNMLFVCIFQMDAAGVAIATVLANLVSALILLQILMKRSDMIHVEVKKLGIDKATFAEVIRIGLPAGVQNAVFSLANVVIQGAINSLGTTVIAASSASLLLEMTAYSIFSSFGQACTTFVGQNYGARQLDRCRRILKLCLLEDAALTCLAIIIAVFFGKDLLALINDNPEVVDFAYIRVVTVFSAYFFSLLYDVMSGYLRGFGVSFLPSLLTITGVCGVRLLWVWLVFPVPAYHNFQWLMYVYPASLGTTAFLIFCALMWCRPSRRFK